MLVPPAGTSSHISPTRAQRRERTRHPVNLRFCRRARCHELDPAPGLDRHSVSARIDRRAPPSRMVRRPGDVVEAAFAIIFVSVTDPLAGYELARSLTAATSPIGPDATDRLLQARCPREARQFRHAARRSFRDQGSDSGACPRPRGAPPAKEQTGTRPVFETSTR